MPDLPMISVIIPTYNRLQHLRSAVGCVLSQTYDNVQLVIVDNNSTDGTAQYAMELAAHRAGVIAVRETRQGLNPARNRGLREAHGDLVAYLDDDELAPTYWLSRLWDCLQVTGAAGVGGPYRPLWEGPPDPWLQNSECLKEMVGVCHWSRKREPIGWLVGGNCLYRRDALLQVGGFGEYVGYTGRASLSDGADVAVGERLRNAGHELFFEPEAYVLHKIPRSRQRLLYVLRRAFWNGYAVARNKGGYDLSSKTRRARRRGRDAYLLGAFILPGYLWGRLARLAGA